MFDITIAGTLPDQSLTDSQIIQKYGSLKNYYRYSGMYYAKYFNRLPTNDFDKTRIGIGTSVAAQIQDNYLYLHGLQQNNTFAYLEQIEDGGQIVNLATPYLPGQDIATILTFLQGQFLGIASSAEPSIKVLNPDIKNKITKEIKMVEVARKFSSVLEKIKAETGIAFEPPANPNASTDEVIKTVMRSFATGLQEDADKLLSYIKQNSMGYQDYVRGYMDAIVGRRCVLFVNDDGQLENVPPYSYGYVSARDDDYGRYDVARMKFRYAHKDEILAKYHPWLTREDQKLIRTASFMSDAFYSQLSQMYNYSLFGGTQDFLAEMDIYYKATLDMGYRVVKDDNGNKRAYKLKEGGRKKGMPTQVLKKCKLIANMFVVDYGIYDIIEDPVQEGNKLFPIVAFMPNTYNGVNQSLVDRTKGKQMELDAIDFRIRENYTTDLGTIISMNSKKFINGVTPTQLYGQLRKTRMTMSVPTGEPGDPTDREPMMQREDVSLMRDIENYLRIKAEFKNDIKEIANVSSAIMGTPTEYIGLKTQQNSAALASNSVQYVMTGTLQLFADAAAIAIEKLKKIVTSDPDNPKWQNLLGEDGVERLLAIKDDKYTEFLLSLSTRDIIDPVVRAKIGSMMEGFAAVQMIDPVDYLNTLTAKTLSELKDDLEFSVKKKEAREQMRLMLQEASANERTAIMAEGQAKAKQIEQQGQLAGKQEVNVGKAAVELLKQGYSPEDAAILIKGGGAPAGLSNVASGQQMPLPPSQEQIIDVTESVQI